MVALRIIDLGIEQSRRALLLVVDDEANIQSLINDALGDDYRIISAFNGRDGIKKAKSSQPDLIVMDIVMPDIGGYEAIRALQDDEATAKIPVLVFSAQDFDSSTIAMIKSEKNVVGFIPKPFRAKALKETIRMAIQKKID